MSRRWNTSAWARIFIFSHCLKTYPPDKDSLPPLHQSPGFHCAFLLPYPVNIGKPSTPDGTGLFFEIVAAVYEPVGINVRYEIVPWIREKQADAMLCVVKQNIGEGILAPKYPMVVEYTAAVFKKAKLPNWEGIGSLVGKNLIWPLGYVDFQDNDFWPG